MKICLFNFKPTTKILFGQYNVSTKFKIKTCDIKNTQYFSDCMREKIEDISS